MQSQPTEHEASGGDREDPLARARAEAGQLRRELDAARAQLAESEERFRTVLDQSIDVAYRRNLREDRYDYMSPAIEAISGYTVEEFSRVASDKLLDYIHPDDHAVVKARIERFRRAQDGHKIVDLFEYRLKCKDGRYRWISDSGVVVLGPDRVPLYHVGVARDITERKRQEDALRRSNEELEQKVVERTARLRRLASELAVAEQRERKRLSDYLHDDLQQVLVAAKLEAERLALLPQSAEAQRRLGKLHDLMTEALNRTRSISKELVTPLLYLVGFVPALRQLAEQMEQRHGLRVALDVHNVADLLPEAIKPQLFDSVRELLFNVSKHAGTDEAHVRVDMAQGRLSVTVSDAGKGFVPNAVLSGDSRDAGYGLYSISERMVDLGGSMEVGSEPGGGTRITLSVPVVRPSRAPQAPRPAAAAGAAGRASAAAGDRARVLVADDHDVVRCGIVAVLSHERNLKVVGQAVNGREAFDLTRQLRPDVVVMDIQMPEMDGIQATRLIKAEFPETLVVGVSAFSDPGFRTAMRSAGAADLLDKAGAGVSLVPTINRLLAARAAPDLPVCDG